MRRKIMNVGGASSSPAHSREQEAPATFRLAALRAETNDCRDALRFPNPLPAAYDIRVCNSSAFGVDLLVSYGLFEVCCTTTMNPPETGLYPGLLAFY
jgi:hypothetical protein